MLAHCWSWAQRLSPRPPNQWAPCRACPPAHWLSGCPLVPTPRPLSSAPVVPPAPSPAPAAGAAGRGARQAGDCRGTKQPYRGESSRPLWHRDAPAHPGRAVRGEAWASPAHLHPPLQQQQLQPLSHHAPTVPLTPRPAGLLTLSGALAAQAQLVAAKEERAGAEAQAARGELGG